MGCDRQINWLHFIQRSQSQAARMRADVEKFGHQIFQCNRRETIVSMESGHRNVILLH